jgi:hypothetical protein
MQNIVLFFWVFLQTAFLFCTFALGNANVRSILENGMTL